MEIVSLVSEVFDIANNDDEAPDRTISLQELQIMGEHVNQHHVNADSKSRMFKTPQDKWPSAFNK